MGDKVFEISELFLFKFPKNYRHERETVRIEQKNLDWFIERSKTSGENNKELLEAYFLNLMGFDLFYRIPLPCPMVFVEDNVLQAVYIEAI